MIIKKIYTIIIILCIYLILNLNATNKMKTLEKNISNEIEDDKKIKKADLIIFSYDRPIQLYAFLESLKKTKNIDYIGVIYRISDSKYEDGYKIVKNDFKNLKFFKQGENPSKDFKPLLLKLLFKQSNQDYFLFAVDDIIVTDKVDLSECIKYIEKYKALGFFLRLGKNITSCYTINQTFNLPKLKEKQKNVFSWQFKGSPGDWGLPASTDMTIYNKNDFKNLFYTLNYTNPNNFEGCWINSSDQTKSGLCFESSKIVNIPINIVQDIKWHRCMNFLLPNDLLEIFLDGYKIDIEDLITTIKNARNTAPHMEYIYKFIKRTPQNS
ncbi:hypothetical protein GF322_00850 [Candidatus Dependentiae bacterium]|nr:hypothetical protein [Candidatus Dependentiae bacterium]